MKYLKFSLLTGFFIFGFLGQANAAAECSSDDSKAIQASIIDYVKKQSAMSPSDINIMSEKCADSYASATVHPTKPVTDDATIYLQNVGGQWKVLSMGTSFDEEFLATIPKEIQN